MNRRNRLVISLIAPMALLAGCGSVSPDAGQEAVLIQKPWFFGSGGVVAEPVKTGRTYVALSTDSVVVDMRPQQHREQFSDLMSQDGIPLDFDTHLQLQVTDSVRLVERFGDHWYENNIGAQFRTFVRQAVRKHGMNETAIQTTAIDAIDNEVTREMRAYIARAQIPVRLMMVTVGRANPPDAIKTQRVRTASEQQRQITELQTQHAEEARLAAEQARARADNAYRESMSLTPEQFVELSRVNMIREVCAPSVTPGQPLQWHGCTFISGGSASAIVNNR